MGSGALVRLARLAGVGLFVLAAGACDTNSPTDVQHPTADPVTLEVTPLFSGGEGVVISAAFDGLELRPAVDEEGENVPDRWTNLQVTVDGEEVASRRLDSDRIEFDIPVLPAGRYAVDVETPRAAADATLSVRVLGILSSDRPNIDEGCALFELVTFVRIGHELAFHTRCLFFLPGNTFRQGYATVAPPVAGKGLRWLPGLFFDGERSDGRDVDRIPPGPSIREGHLVVKQGSDGNRPDMAVWRIGSDSEFVESLTCFGGVPDPPYHEAQIAEVAPGVCLAVHGGNVWRNGVEIAGVGPSAISLPIVLAADGWSALRRTERLIVFDASGALAFQEEAATASRVRDVAFSGDGRLYVARETESGSELQLMDRSTGELLIGTEIAGELLALRIVDDRLWAMRRAFVPGEDQRLLVDVYDPATLLRERSIAVSPEYSVFPPALASLMGDVPMLHADVTGTRAYLVGSGRVTGIARAIYMHIVEVF